MSLLYCIDCKLHKVPYESHIKGENSVTVDSYEVVKSNFMCT